MKLEYVGTVIVNCGKNSTEIHDVVTKALNDQGYNYTSRKDDKFADEAMRITIYAGDKHEGNN